ncbi:MAG: hypothetical protein SFZ02_19450 [bacterium]|nr:hypothetical protein [bacterium]
MSINDDTIKITKLGTTDEGWNEAELEAVFASTPKSGAWIVANNPAIGAWADMEGDTLEWSIQLRHQLETLDSGFDTLLF